MNDRRRQVYNELNFKDNKYRLRSDAWVIPSTRAIRSRT